MKILFIFAIFACFIMLLGCNTKRSALGTTSSNSSLNTAVTQHDEQISKLTFQFNQIKGSNKNCVEHINNLNKKIAVLKRKIITLEQAHKQFANQLNAEKTARQNEIDRLLKEVAKQTAAAVNSRSSTSTNSSSGRSPSGPAIKGEFYEYTVEPGATLGAIARAYKVSVSDIKKANKLHSDHIRAGQKLYIPKK